MIQLMLVWSLLALLIWRVRDIMQNTTPSFSTLIIDSSSKCVNCCVDSFPYRPARSVSNLVLVQVSRDGRFDVRGDESLKTFCDYGGESNWAIVRQFTVPFFGTGMMVADFRQEGTADCSSERLEMVMKTSASWSA